MKREQIQQALRERAKKKRDCAMQNLKRQAMSDKPSPIDPQLPEGAHVLAQLGISAVMMPGKKAPALILTGCHGDLLTSLELLDDGAKALRTFHQQLRMEQRQGAKQSRVGLVLPNGQPAPIDKPDVERDSDEDSE